MWVCQVLYCSYFQALTNSLTTSILGIQVSKCKHRPRVPRIG
jgi:hypothetical protein